MSLQIFSGAEKSVRFSLSRISIIFLFLVFTSAVFVEASIGGTVTFSWQANPSEDYVIGYRLYYGADSRFNSNGTLKTSFSYDYYIDFSDFMRCDASSNGTSCEMLRPEELQCENLYESVPQCTISNLYGYLYFTLTAYNAQAESSFTPELSLTVTPENVNPEGLTTVPQIILMLLLKKNK